MSDLTVELNDYARKLISALSPEQRKKAEKAIATELRRNMRQRLTRQEDIYGVAFKPRKREKYKTFKRARTRKKKMLLGFRDKAWLRIHFEKSKLSVGYNGRAGVLAEVHNEGLAQIVGGRQGKHWAQYPERRWIGLSDEDKHAIDEIIEDFLTI